jgi:hypothetical protein
MSFNLHISRRVLSTPIVVFNHSGRWIVGFLAHLKQMSLPDVLRRDPRLLWLDTLEYFKSTLKKS